MAGGDQRILVFEVAWCDPYLGYTLYEWMMEVRDILEQEYGVRIVVAKAPVCLGEPDPVLMLEGEPVLRGLPGEEGYLIEELKRVIEERVPRANPD